MEEWRKVPGYRRDLQVSSLGRISSVKVIGGKFKRHIYKLQAHKNGTVGISTKNPKEGIEHSFVSVVRLMAEAFFDGCNPREILFLDGDNTNLTTENMRHTTASRVVRHLYQSDMKNIKETKYGTFSVICDRKGKKYYFGTMKTLEEAKMVRSIEIPKLDRRLKREAIQRVTK